MNIREIEFLQDLEALLERHGVELIAMDDIRHPGFSDIQIEAYASPDYENCNGDGIDLSFGDNISVDRIHEIIVETT